MRTSALRGRLTDTPLDSRETFVTTGSAVLFLLFRQREAEPTNAGDGTRFRLRQRRSSQGRGVDGPLTPLPGAGDLGRLRSRHEELLGERRAVDVLGRADGRRRDREHPA